METTPKTILLTGGTGFIGSHIAAELLNKGHFLYLLARKGSQITAEERIFRAIVPLTLMPQGRYRVLEGDLVALPNNIPVGSIDEVWHCAASLSFKEEDKIETFATNILGTKNVLDFMKKHGVGRMHFVGTAYVCGREKGKILESRTGTEFYNPYEESKAISEGHIRDWAKDTGGKYTIYRPSIIVGNSKNGYTSKFDGYYTCSRGFYLLKKFLSRDIVSHPQKYENSCFRLDRGTLNLPLFFPGLRNTTVNMLPVELAVKIIMLLSQFEGTFHVTNSYSVNLDKLVKMTMKALDISGVEVGNVDHDSFDGPVAQFQRQITNASKYYTPYANYGANGPVFDQTNVTAILEKEIEFKITESFIKTIISFAISVNFKG